MRKLIKKTVLILSLSVFSLLALPTVQNLVGNPQGVVLAVGEGGATGTTPETRLKAAIKNKIYEDNTTLYKRKDGSTLKGKEIVDSKGDLIPHVFDSLDKESKDRIAQVMSQEVDVQIERDSRNSQQTNPITFATKESWIKDVMKTKGAVSSTFAILNTQVTPDLLAGQRILGPLFPIFNIVVGVLIIVAVAYFMASFGVDVFVIVTPAQHYLATAAGSGAGSRGAMGSVAAGIGSAVKEKRFVLDKWVSREAINVIKANDGASTGKLLMGYGMKRIIALAVFMVLIAIIASGNLMRVVGSVLDAAISMMGW